MLRTSSGSRSLHEILPSNCSSCGCIINSHGLDLHPKCIRDFYNSDSELIQSTILAELHSTPLSSSSSSSSSLNLPALNMNAKSPCASSCSFSSLPTTTSTSNANLPTQSSSPSLAPVHQPECSCSCHFNMKPVYPPCTTLHFHPDDVHPKVLREIENKGTEEQRKMLHALENGHLKKCSECSASFSET